MAFILFLLFGGYLVACSMDPQMNHMEDNYVSLGQLEVLVLQYVVVKEAIRSSQIY